ncbi:MAG: hypothetical protein IBJ09_12745 [Bacteroidia bacterium]|nr:hypothetical protein [Bacteroidia bacterium]
MKKQQKFSRAAGIVALVTALMLLVPLVAMQFSTEVNWSPADFLVMGTLIAGTGMAYVWLSRGPVNRVYRLAAALALGAAFLMIWTNLAVGLIGSGPNAANLMYMVVIPVLIAGTLRARMKAAGMERTMYAASLLLVLLAGIALLTGMQRYSGGSATEILGISGFFAGLFFIAGLLFRYASVRRVSRQV